MSFIDYTADLIRILSRPTAERDSVVSNVVTWIRKRNETLAWLDEDLITEVVKNSRLESIAENELVMRQGLEIACFYVLLSGKATAYELKISDPNAPDTRRSARSPRPDANAAAETTFDSDLISLAAQAAAVIRRSLGKRLLTLQPGASFGEAALVEENPIADESVITDEHCSFMVIDRSLYSKALKIQQDRETAQRASVVEACYLFSGFSRKQRNSIIGNLRKIRIDADRLIVKQGDPLKAIYLLSSGSAKVTCQPEMHIEQLKSFFSRMIPLPDKHRYPAEHVKRQEEEDLISLHFANALVEQNVRLTFRPPKLVDVAVAQTDWCIGDFELSLGLDKFAFSCVTTTACEVFALDLCNLERYYNFHKRLARQHLNLTDLLLQNTEERILKRIELNPALKSLLFFRRALTYIGWQKALIARMKWRMQLQTASQTHIAGADDETVDDLDSLLKATQAAPTFVGRIDEAGAAARAHYKKNKAAWSAKLRLRGRDPLTYMNDKTVTERGKPRSIAELRRLFAYTNLDDVGLPKTELRERLLELAANVEEKQREVASAKVQTRRALRSFKHNMPEGFDLDVLAQLHERFLRQESTARQKCRVLSVVSMAKSGMSTASKMSADENRKALLLEDRVRRFVMGPKRAPSDVLESAENDTSASLTLRKQRSKLEANRMFPHSFNRPAYDPLHLPKPGAKILLRAVTCKAKEPIVIESRYPNDTKPRYEILNPNAVHDHIRSFVVPYSIVPYILPQ